MGTAQSKYTGKTVTKKAVCIDIGSCYSGFAYTTDPKSAINLNPKWDKEKTIIRTPSHVALDGNGELFDFGLLEKVSDTCRVQIIENIKLQVLDQNQEKKFWTVKTNNGTSIEARLAFVAAIEYMKSKSKTALSGCYAGSHQKICSEDILWIITIPSNGEENHREFMFLVASAARLWNSYSTASDFLIISEGQASLHFCKNLSDNDFIISDRRYPNRDKIMVIDAGGGTVDFAVSIKEEENSVETETHHFSAIKAGGEYVCKKFEDYIKGTSPEMGSFFNKMTEEKRGFWKKCLAQFSEAKLAFHGENIVKFRIPNNNFDFDKLIENLDGISVNIEQSHYVLTITPTVMRERCFRPVTNEILRKIEVLHREHNGIQAIFLVGGFSESKFLRQEVCQKAKDLNIGFFLPKNANTCVMKGGIEFAYSHVTEDPYVSPITYSFAVGKNGRPPSLEPLVRKRQSVNSGEFIQRLVSPYYLESDWVIDIYLSVDRQSRPSKAKHLCKFCCREAAKHKLIISFTSKNVRISLSRDDAEFFVTKTIAHEHIRARNCTVM